MQFTKNNVLNYIVKECKECPFWSGFPFVEIDDDEDDYCTINPNDDKTTCLLKERKEIVVKIS